MSVHEICLSLALERSSVNDTAAAPRRWQTAVCRSQPGFPALSLVPAQQAKRWLHSFAASRASVGVPVRAAFSLAVRRDTPLRSSPQLRNRELHAHRFTC